MAVLKVLVSSTCYDLGILRSHLRGLISSLGYEPVMSEYSDVLFDPSIHTHTSCIHEVENCDCMIVIIGSRFGGTVVPRALNAIDLDVLKKKSKSTKLLEKTDAISITQAEVFKALEEGMPIFTFVDQKVYNDHLVYEKNKGKPIASEIDYPSIDKKETAEYIFEFINFIRHLTENNAIQPFSRIEDIDSHLKRQWSMLLQRLLYQNRFRIAEEKRFDILSKQIGDLQTAVLSSLPTNELRETARGTIRFRGMLELLLNLTRDTHTILSSLDWTSLMRLLDIVQIAPIVDVRRKYGRRELLAFVKQDGSFYLTRYSFSVHERIIKDWEEFRQLPSNRKEGILGGVADNSEPDAILPMVERFDMTVSEFQSKYSGDKVAGTEPELGPGK